MEEILGADVARKAVAEAMVEIITTEPICEFVSALYLHVLFQCSFCLRKLRDVSMIFRCRTCTPLSIW